jgi:hypothetical protein
MVFKALEEFLLKISGKRNQIGVNKISYRDYLKMIFLRDLKLVSGIRTCLKN